MRKPLGARIRRKSLCGLWAFATICFVSLDPCFSQTWEAFTGFQIDNQAQYLAYGGLRAKTDRFGLPFEPVLQVFAFRQQFFFRSAGVLERAQLNQVTPALGVTKQIGGWQVGALAGPALRYTREEVDLGEHETNRRVGYTVQAEASYWSERDGVETLATYTNLDNFFFSRARWKHTEYQLPSGHPITPGLELLAMGNAEFKAVLAGGLLETELGKLVVLLKGGYQNNSTFHSGEYAGIEFYLPF